MTPTKVSVSLGLTVNLGGFNSSRMDCFVEGNIDPGESVDAAMDKCHEIVKNKLDVSIQAMKKYYIEKLK